MALPITTFSIVEVAKPNIGEKQPSRVRADVSVNLSVKDNVKMEWENLRRYEIKIVFNISNFTNKTRLKNFNIHD